MKKSGIINQPLATAIAGLGHLDMVVIADAGLPIPDGPRRIDLADERYDGMVARYRRQRGRHLHDGAPSKERIGHGRRDVIERSANNAERSTTHNTRCCRISTGSLVRTCNNKCAATTADGAVSDADVDPHGLRRDPFTTH